MTTNRLRAGLAAISVLLLLAPAASALAAGVQTFTIHERQVDVNPGETNPCTGATGTIVDYERDVFHITTLADGTYHLTGHATLTVVFAPDDPNQVAYEGHETFAVSESSSSRTFVTTMASQVRVKGTDGTFVTFRVVSHLTVSPTGVVRSFERPSFICS